MEQPKAGCLYSGPRNNDQSYGLYIPIWDGDKGPVMQDTYQIRRPSMKNGETQSEAAIRQCFDFGPGYNGYELRNVREIYYHKNQFPFSSDFKLVCDLSEFEPIKSPDRPSEFKEDDLVRGVKLFSEHGYNWDRGPVGVNLVRKGAEKEQERIVAMLTADLCRNMIWPNGGKYEARLLREKIQENTSYSTPEAQRAIAKSEKLEKMRDEFEAFCKVLQS